MKIQLIAYATDCTVVGWHDLRHDRLADVLAATDSVAVDSPVIRALDDGRVVELTDLSLHRSEVCLVAATGPRGDALRRLATVTRPVLAVAGPYEVSGRLHGPASTNPLELVRRRRWIALTDVALRYRSRGRLVALAHDAVLLNTDLIATVDELDDMELDMRRAPGRLTPMPGIGSGALAWRSLVAAAGR